MNTKKISLANFKCNMKEHECRITDEQSPMLEDE